MNETQRQRAVLDEIGKARRRIKPVIGDGRDDALAGKGLSEEATTSFLAAYPGYERTTLLDDVRQTEYPYLDGEGHAYLDYTGAGLAAVSQYRSHAERLAEGCFGNPHSANPASIAATDLVEGCRSAVLEYFNAHRMADEIEAVYRLLANAHSEPRLPDRTLPVGRWPLGQES